MQPSSLSPFMKRHSKYVVPLFLTLFFLSGVAWGATPAKINAKESGGRVTEIKARITKKNLGGGSGTSAAARKWAKEWGCPGDDAGHVIARSLGGGGGIKSGNIFPQHGAINRGNYRTLEKKAVQWAKEYGYVDIKVRFEYENSKIKRPKQLHYIVEAKRFEGKTPPKDGRRPRWSTTLPNPKPSKCVPKKR